MEQAEVGVGAAVKAKSLLSQQSPPPCEKFKCWNFEKCKAELLACRSFHYYVLTGRAVPPRMVWAKEDRARRRGYIDPAAGPTRSRYMKIFHPEDWAARFGIEPSRRAERAQMRAVLAEAD